MLSRDFGLWSLIFLNANSLIELSSGESTNIVISCESYNAIAVKTLYIPKLLNLLQDLNSDEVTCLQFT